MIFYLAKRGYETTWRRSIEQAYSVDDPSIRHELFERIELLTYDKLFRQTELRAGSYVFSDLERLTPEETERAAICWETLSGIGPACRIFNHPVASMRRFELLRNLYESGVNSFNVQRLTEPLALQRYPLFIRKESGHRKEDVSSLLHNRDQFLNAVEELIAACESRDDRIVSEYLDVSDGKGRFHRFSALVAARRVIAMYEANSENWFVKSLGAKSYEHLRALTERYSAHHQQVLEIFKTARIDYGRVDYAVVDGRIQVFEINTNPRIGGARVLLDVARALDSPINYATYKVTRTWKPPKVEARDQRRAFWRARRLHFLLRSLGLLKYENNLLNLGRTLRKLVRQS